MNLLCIDENKLLFFNKDAKKRRFYDAQKNDIQKNKNIFCDYAFGHVRSAYGRCLRYA